MIQRIAFIMMCLVLSHPALAQQKDCTQSAGMVEFGYEGGHADMQVRAGKYCTRYLNVYGFSLKEFIIVEKPKFGRIERQMGGQAYWRYVANQNYRGPDSFRLRFVGERVDWQSGRTLDKTFFGQKYNVTVIQ